MQSIPLVIKIIFFILFFFISNLGYSNNVGIETGFEIPRFVSIKSDEANIRVGPSKNYPIILKYVVKDLPIKIIEEYEEWRKVEDFKKNVGWIHKSLISGIRTGIILSEDNNDIELLYTLNGNVIGEIGKGNIVHLEKCKIDLCLISRGNYRGWINKTNIWGVKEKEIFRISFLQRFEDLYWKSFNYLKIIFIRF